MTTEILFAVDGTLEGGYIAHAAGQAIFVEANTLTELRAQVRDAVACHFEPGDSPRLIHLHFRAGSGLESRYERLL